MQLQVGHVLQVHPVAHDARQAASAVRLAGQARVLDPVRRLVLLHLVVRLDEVVDQGGVLLFVGSPLFVQRVVSELVLDRVSQDFAR